MKRIPSSSSKVNSKVSGNPFEATSGDIDTTASLIQLLLPLGLQAAVNWMQEEVYELVGAPYDRNRPINNYRWGQQPGSIYLGDSKQRINVPRVRSGTHRTEVPLKRYAALQNPGTINELALQRTIHGISCRNYKNAAVSVGETFGISGSSISRKCIRVTEQKLRELQERRLDQYDITAIFLDGKRFGDDGIVVALGVTMQGDKIVLGIVQAAGENHTVCKDFFCCLEKRGLCRDHGLLFIVDGSKGFDKAIRELYGPQAVIQRCQWHKRENIVSYLPERYRSEYRIKLQKAYNLTDYQEAKAALTTIYRELKTINLSAANSLLEGLEETLTIQRLGIAAKLGKSLRTTNCIESLFSHTGRITGRISYWRNSSQKQRWVATALLTAESSLNKIQGHLFLKELRDALKKEMASHTLQQKAA